MKKFFFRDKLNSIPTYIYILLPKFGILTFQVLLEKGSDINAQIETNRNTALTLACFQVS